MKKTISVLLAIVLAFSFSSAFAGRLDYQPGHGTIVKFDDFKATFTDFISEFKYNVEWSSGPRSKDGFEVYEARIARMDDGTLDMDVYTENGNVAYFDVYGSAYDDDAGNNLKWLLEKVKDTCYTVFCIIYLEDYMNGGHYTAKEIAEAGAESWAELYAGLKEDMKSGSYQFAYTMNVLDCPVGITLMLDGSTFVLNVYIMNSNSRVWVE